MNNIIKRKWNQNSMVIIEDLQGMAFQAESGGHTFQISGIDGEGNAVALSGTPAGVMLRADGQDVALTCSVSGGVVSATLPANAYSVPGRFGLTIFLTSDGQKTAIYAAVGTVGKTSSGTVAPPAGSDVVDLVNAIAAAVATIPASYTDLMASVAPTYSSSGLYAVGSYAWYNGKLYRCTTAITTAETWTAAHWTLANLGSDLVDLKSAITHDESVIFDNLGTLQYSFWENGSIITSGDTIDVTDIYYTDNPWKHLVVPCVAGDKFHVLNTGDSQRKPWAFVASDKTKLTFSSISVADEDITAPSNAVYLVCNVKLFPSPNTHIVTKIGTNKTVQNAKYIDIMQKAESLLLNGNNVVDPLTIIAGKRARVSDGAIVDALNNLTFVTDYIPVQPGVCVTLANITDSNNYGTVFYDINKEKLEGYPSRYEYTKVYAPPKSAYCVMTFLTADLSTAAAYYSAKIIDEIKYPKIVEKTKWIAMGDSITFGVYSEFDGAETTTGTCDGWVRYLADAMNYDITVMASKGMGYTATVTGQDPEGGSTRISISTLLDRIVALEGDYNLITICYGINDYNNPSQSTLETIMAGLDEAISRLATRFKFARIVVITPFNASRYGNDASNYCYNTKRSNGLSIKDIADAIQDRCKYYGVECIYASNGFLLNNYNIATLLPDGVHPAQQTHKLIAKNMAHYLLN